ncbi:MAG: hypothetical protein PHT95_00545 [Candidatus Omnitrophica bacterium]|nr:hypothetical protein [Candidatus Omnitrophota bacterium]MDD4013933.1 hypothetical protein [Candidatus Omnitrophota bacterium]
MKHFCMFFLVCLFVICFAAGPVFCAEIIKYDFEDGDEGWKIPDWAYYQKDHKAISSEVSTDVSYSGKKSLKVIYDFPGNVWAAGIVEVEKDYDLTDYDEISVEVFLPKSGPQDLILARLILTVGIGWQFTEMRHPVILERGKWTKVSAKLESQEVPESDWKGRGPRRLYHNIGKVAKIAVRAEYDAAPPHRIGPRYEGPLYIDNLLITPKK